MNHACKRTLSLSTCALQRGFVPGRQLIENIVDLDTEGRIYGMKAASSFAGGSGCCPILAFWDFAAAFPSVAHAWLFLVLEARGVPDGFLAVIVAMYDMVCAFAVADGCTTFLFWILTGVLQGCPLSGMLFAIIMDPFLVKFEMDICSTGKGCVRACADDVGAALSSLHDLIIAKEIFDTAK